MLFIYLFILYCWLNAFVQVFIFAIKQHFGDCGLEMSRIMQFRNPIKAYNMSPLKRMYVNELPKLSQTQWMLMTCGNAIVLWWIMQRIRLLSGVLQITIRRRYINLAVPIPFTLEPGGDVVNGQLESRAISLGDILAGEQYESRTVAPGRRCRPEPFAGRCFRRSVWALHCTDVDCKLCQKKKKKKEKRNALLSHFICNALCLNYISHSDKAVRQTELQENRRKGLWAKNKAKC